MKKNTLLSMLVILAACFNLSKAQVGINTTNPQATLDITGKPATASSLDGMIPPRITGNQLRAKTYTPAQTGAIVYVTAADSAPAGQTINVKSTGFYYFNGAVWATITINNIPNGTGNILAIDGQPQIAQEISTRLDGDFTVPTVSGTSSPVSIGRMTQKLIDNNNSFTGTATNNTFTVSTDGTYLVTMNFSLQSGNTTPINGNCYFGLKSVSDNQWVAFNIETIDGLIKGNVKNLSYQVAIDLVASKTYSFAITQQHNGTGTPLALMRGTGTTSTGGYFPMTFFSVKRLK
jgi:hypothetical protein